MNTLTEIAKAMNKANKRKENEFRIGDKVIFIFDDKEECKDKIPNYYTESNLKIEENRNLIQHGTTLLGEEYIRNKGRIVGIDNNNIYLVQYKSKDNEPMCLGFKKNNLQLFNE